MDQDNLMFEIFILSVAAAILILLIQNLFDSFY
mgnify:CR=1 FL=1